MQAVSREQGGKTRELHGRSDNFEGVESREEKRDERSGGTERKAEAGPQEEGKDEPSAAKGGRGAGPGAAGDPSEGDKKPSGEARLEGRVGERSMDANEELGHTGQECGAAEVARKGRGKKKGPKGKVKNVTEGYGIDEREGGCREEPSNTSADVDADGELGTAAGVEAEKEKKSGRPKKGGGKEKGLLSDEERRVRQIAQLKAARARKAQIKEEKEAAAGTYEERGRENGHAGAESGEQAGEKRRRAYADEASASPELLLASSGAEERNGMALEDDHEDSPKRKKQRKGLEKASELLRAMGIGGAPSLIGATKRGQAEAGGEGESPGAQGALSHRGPKARQQPVQRGGPPPQPGGMTQEQVQVAEPNLQPADVRDSLHWPTWAKGVATSLPTDLRFNHLTPVNPWFGVRLEEAVVWWYPGADCREAGPCKLQHLRIWLEQGDLYPYLEMRHADGWMPPCPLQSLISLANTGQLLILLNQRGSSLPTTPPAQSAEAATAPQDAARLTDEIAERYRASTPKMPEPGVINFGAPPTSKPAVLLQQPAAGLNRGLISRAIVTSAAEALADPTGVSLQQGTEGRVERGATLREDERRQETRSPAEGKRIQEVAIGGEGSRNKLTVQKRPRLLGIGCWMNGESGPDRNRQIGTVQSERPLVKLAADLAKGDGLPKTRTGGDGHAEGRSGEADVACKFLVADTGLPGSKLEKVKLLSELLSVPLLRVDVAEEEPVGASDATRAPPAIRGVALRDFENMPRETEPERGLVGKSALPCVERWSVAGIRNTLAEGSRSGAFVAAVPEKAEAASGAEGRGQGRGSRAEACIPEGAVANSQRRVPANGGPATRSVLAVDRAEAAGAGASDVVFRTRKSPMPVAVKDSGEGGRPEKGAPKETEANRPLFGTEAVASKGASDLIGSALRLFRKTAGEGTSTAVGGTSVASGKEGSRPGCEKLALLKTGPTTAASEGPSKRASGVEQVDEARHSEDAELSDSEDHLRYHLNRAKGLVSGMAADRQERSLDAKPSSIEPAPEKQDCCQQTATVLKLRQDLEAARAQLVRERERARRSLEENTRELLEQVAAERAALERDEERLQSRREELEERERSGGGVRECISCMDDWSATTVRHLLACGHALICRKCSVEWLSRQGKPPYKCSVGCNLRKSKAIKPVYLG